MPDGTSHRPCWTAPLAVALVVPLYVLGIRGRLEVKSPLRIGTSYFCANPFLNQLGQNAAFVLLRTSMDMGKRDRQHLDYMPAGEAVTLIRTELGLSGEPADSLRPLARTVVPQGTPTRQNVVVILMESMALHYIGDPSLTPFLNSLIRRSDYYTHAFSAGIHTMNGLAATFFAEPALMNQHPFKTNQIQRQQSLPEELRRRGYRTYYFTTHDEQFDNVAGYLLANDVEHIISKKDYPEEEILSSSLGCADDYLFRHGIGVLNRAAEQGDTPFLGVFLTINNHPPYTVPPYYKARHRDMEEQVVEYADWALSEFFRLAEQEPWYGNTLFVLTGDHGRVQSGEPYDVSLAYHRIPLCFFDPTHTAGSVRHGLALQNDVFPTVMGRLNLPWTNTTTGIDLERDSHRYVCFSSDNAYACVDSTHYYVCRDTGLKTLYDYTKEDGRDLLAMPDSRAEEKKQLAERMDSLARAYLQTGQHLVDLRIRSNESTPR
ncbi:MAG: LTA synthase family protein [Clostridium sp.]|nr:LTA synthase family protein [Clostridium sp.]